jgi:hypothetical protein
MAVEDDIKICQAYIRTVQGAKDRGIECTLSLKKFQQLKRTTRCYYTNTKLTIGEPAKAQADNWSLDRLDNDKGYTDNNVVVCSQRINAKKGSMSLDEIKSISNGLKKKNLI